MAREKVKKGHTTWEELESVGMALPLKRGTYGAKRLQFETIFEEKVGKLREEGK